LLQSKWQVKTHSKPTRLFCSNSNTAFSSACLFFFFTALDILDMTCWHVSESLHSSGGNSLSASSIGTTREGFESMCAHVILCGCRARR
jgi:hypothetical protein